MFGLMRVSTCIKMLDASRDHYEKQSETLKVIADSLRLIARELSRIPSK